MTIRIGIDLGGSKIALTALSLGDEVVHQATIATPREDYVGTLEAIAAMVREAESAAGRRAVIGVGMPGSISPATGRVQNANSTWLNGTPFDRDLMSALGRPLRVANDANCFALSEAFDGAAREADTVFGVILGTGCGGGFVVAGRAITGRHAITGEWGHTPLPAPKPDEQSSPKCWCGRYGCLESWLSGPAMSADHARRAGIELSAEAIAEAAAGGCDRAQSTLDRHLSRLARGLAGIVNIIDPEMIVIGGGLSGLNHLYERLPKAIASHVFADHCRIDIQPPLHGPASGARGAARLWQLAEL